MESPSNGVKRSPRPPATNRSPGRRQSLRTGTRLTRADSNADDLIELEIPTPLSETEHGTHPAPVRPQRRLIVPTEARPASPLPKDSMRLALDVIRERQQTAATDFAAIASQRESAVRAEYQRLREESLDATNRQQLVSLGILRITVHNAAGLAATDTSRNTSDPYCVVTVVQQPRVEPARGTSPTFFITQESMTDHDELEQLLTQLRASTKSVPPHLARRTITRYSSLAPAWHQKFEFKCDNVTRHTCVAFTIGSAHSPAATDVGMTFLPLGRLVGDSALSNKEIVVRRRNCSATSVHFATVQSATNVTLKLHGTPGSVTISWAYEPGGDIQAMRGAQLLRDIGVRDGSTIAALPATLRRLLAAAAEHMLSNDIAHHLPVMEPVFQFVMDTALGKGKSTGAGIIPEGMGAAHVDVASSRGQGVTELEFVGILSKITCIPAPALAGLFAKMDANGDGTLTWDEYISFLLKEAQNSLGHRHAQGCFVVDFPPAQAPAWSTELPDPVDQLQVLPALEGYAAITKRGQVRLFDSQFRHSMSLQVEHRVSIAQSLVAPTDAEQAGFVDPVANAQNLVAMHNLSRFAPDSQALTQRLHHDDESVAAHMMKRAKNLAPATSTKQAKARRLSSQLMDAMAARTGAAWTNGKVKQTISVNQALAKGAAPKAANIMDSLNAGIEAAYGDNVTSVPGFQRGTQVAAITYDHVHNRLYAACGNKSLAVFNLSKFTIQGALSLNEIHRRIHAASAARDESRRSYAAVLDHLTKFRGTKHSAEHIGLNLSYGMGMSYDPETGIPTLTPSEVIVVGPGMPTSMLLTKCDISGSTGHLDRVLAVGDTTGSLCLHDPTSLLLLATMRPHQETLRSLVHVPRLGLVTGSMDGTLIATDVTRCETVRSFEGHSRGIFSLAWCGAEKFFISASYDRQALMWDPLSRSPIGTLTDVTGSGSPIMSVAVNDVHNQIVTVHEDHKFKLWDARTMRCSLQIADTVTDVLRGAVFDVRRLSMISYGSHLRAWPLKEMAGSTINPMQALWAAARRSDFDHSMVSVSRVFAAGQAQTTAALPAKSADSTGPTGPVLPPRRPSTVNYPPTTQPPGQGATKEGMRNFKAMAKAVVASKVASSGVVIPDYSPDAAMAVLYSAAFQQIIVVCWGGTVTVWSLGTGESILSFDASHDDDPSAMEASKPLTVAAVQDTSLLTAAALGCRGRRLITAATNGSVRMWNYSNGDLLRELPPLAVEISSLVQQMPDSSISEQYCVIAGAWGGRLAMWEETVQSAGTVWPPAEECRARSPDATGPPATEPTGRHVGLSPPDVSGPHNTITKRQTAKDGVHWKYQLEDEVIEGHPYPMGTRLLLIPPPTSTLLRDHYTVSENAAAESRSLTPLSDSSASLHAVTTAVELIPRGDVLCCVGWCGIGPSGWKAREVLYEQSDAGERGLHKSGGDSDGGWLAAGTSDGLLVIWSAQGTEPAVIASVNEPHCAVRASIESLVHIPTKNMLVIGTGLGQIKLFLLASCTLIGSHEADVHPTPQPDEAMAITCMAVSADQSWLFVGHANGTAKTFKIASLSRNGLGAPRARFAAHSGAVMACSAFKLSNSEGFISCGGAQVRLWSFNGRGICAVGQTTVWPRDLSSAAKTFKEPTLLSNEEAPTRRSSVLVPSQPPSRPQSQLTIETAVQRKPSFSESLGSMGPTSSARGPRGGQSKQEADVPFEKLVPMSNPISLQKVSPTAAAAARKKDKKPVLGHQIAQEWRRGRPARDHVPVVKWMQASPRQPEQSAPAEEDLAHITFVPHKPVTPASTATKKPTERIADRIVRKLNSLEATWGRSSSTLE